MCDDAASRGSGDFGEMPGLTDKMRWIPAGTFQMGSEDFYPEERPVHRVSWTDSGWTSTR